MKILITGSRHFTNEQQVRDELACWKANWPELEIAHGDSRGGGVDRFVKQACLDFGIKQQPFPVVSALDGRHRGAPLKRNERMVLTFMPDRVVAFRAEGKSNGTDHCIGYADKVGIPTQTIHEEI